MCSYHVLLLTALEDLNEICNACWEFRANWRKIGLDLGINESSLCAIFVDGKKCGDCMIEMFSTWLRRENEHLNNHSGYIKTRYIEKRIPIIALR